MKIDRSFVGAMRSASENLEIVHTIVLLAKNLHLEVIAEGIETGERADFLKTLTCDFGQGYFYSKPVSAEDSRTLIGSKFLNRTSLTSPADSSLDFIQ